MLKLFGKSFVSWSGFWGSRIWVSSWHPKFISSFGMKSKVDIEGRRALKESGQWTKDGQWAKDELSKRIDMFKIIRVDCMNFKGMPNDFAFGKQKHLTLERLHLPVWCAEACWTCSALAKTSIGWFRWKWRWHSGPHRCHPRFPRCHQRLEWKVSQYSSQVWWSLRKDSFVICSPDHFLWLQGLVKLSRT